MNILQVLLTIVRTITFVGYFSRGVTYSFKFCIALTDTPNALKLFRVKNLHM
jgi:hypothetical protein